MAGMAFPVGRTAHAQPGQKQAFPVGLLAALKKPQHALAPMPSSAPMAPPAADAPAAPAAPSGAPAGM